MINSETDSDCEGEPFTYDDNGRNIIFPRRIRRRSETNHHLIVLNNASFLFDQKRAAHNALRLGFDAWKKQTRLQSDSWCDMCFHGAVCSLVVFVAASINHYCF